MTRAALNTTTLCIVDTYTHALAERAVAHCLAQADFADAIFVSDRAPAISGIRHVPIAPLESRDAYSRFVIKDLLEHVRSEHVLLVQWDGYIVNPDAWTNEFLRCDYIGARWGFHRDGHDVGNGGFSLRSRRLLEALQDPEIDTFEPEDDMICRRFRPMLESRHGIRFAPGELADRFSFETTYPKTTPFGFHGLFNIWLFLQDDEVEPFVSAMPDRALGSIQLLQLARNMIELGRREAARVILHQRIDANPGDAEATALLATLATQPTFDAARQQTTSRNAPCPCGSGKRYKHCCGHPAQATAPAAGPGFPELAKQAFAHHQAGRLAEARSAYEAALAVKADPVVLHYLGVLEMQQGDPVTGEKRIREALRQRADLPDMHNNLGLCLRAQRRLPEAIEAYRSAIALDSGYAPGWNNIGLDSHSLGDFAQAADAFERALALSPDLSQARFSRALLRLTQGDFASGWEDYEHRARCPEYAAQYRPPPTPQPPRPWHGKLDDLAGRSLLVIAEQGIGDSIQFVRYADFLAGHGATVSILTSRRSVARLLASCPGVSRVFTTDEAVPQHDLACYMLSLPRLCGTRDIAAIPAKVPYLSAPAESVARWQQRLATLPRDELKVGLCWAGNPTHANDHNRSSRLDTLSTLLRSDSVRWISLQVGAARKHLATAPVSITDWTDDFEDFAETAALISNLDLVISVDTSVAHAAGALGVPTWLMVPYVPDFRWLLEREDSPWYPTMRLFRQSAPGEWSGPASHMSQALARLREEH